MSGCLQFRAILEHGAGNIWVSAIPAGSIRRSRSDPVAARLLNPPGFSDFAEQVAKLVPVTSGDLGNSVDVSDQVSHGADGDLVCSIEPLADR